MSDDMQRLLIEQAAYYSGRDSASDEVAELRAENAALREKVRLLTIQNNARATIIAGHQSMGWDRRAEHLARAQLDSQREANALLTDEVEKLREELATAQQTIKHMADRINGPAF